MQHVRQVATRLGTMGAIILLGLAVVLAAPAAGQEEEASPVATATEVPGLLGCNAPPAFTLSDQVPFTGAPVAWWAAGLQAGTQAAILVTDQQHPQSTFRAFATVDRQCQASGTIVLPLPTLYAVQLIGTSTTTGDAVTITAWLRAVTAPTPVPTPTLALPPAPPINVRATVISATTVRVDWDATGTTQTGFLITSRAGQLRQGPEVRTVTVGGLVPGAIACFAVYAVNDAGTTLGGVDCAIPAPSPTAPALSPTATPAG
jgi:hypothetical protein